LAAITVVVVVTVPVERLPTPVMSTREGRRPRPRRREDIRSGRRPIWNPI
jgi:hypothetical protein